MAGNDLGGPVAGRVRDGCARVGRQDRPVAIHRMSGEGLLCMNGIDTALWSIRRMDHFAGQDTAATRIDPRAKVIAVFAILIGAAAHPPHAVSALLPLLLFPVCLLSLGEIPVRWLASRLLFALPFAFFVGILNPWLDRTPVAMPWGGDMAAGWLTFASIMLRFLIAVSAAFLLVATTGMNRVSKALSQMGVPRVFANQLLFLYRYVFVIGEELLRSIRAYQMRAVNGRHALPPRFYGLLLSGVMSRSIARAMRVHAAMQARGYDGELHFVQQWHWRLSDTLFVVGWTGFAVLCRMIDLPVVLGHLLSGA